MLTFAIFLTGSRHTVMCQSCVSGQGRCVAHECVFTGTAKSPFSTPHISHYWTDFCDVNMVGKCKLAHVLTARLVTIRHDTWIARDH